MTIKIDPDAAFMRRVTRVSQGGSPHIRVAQLECGHAMYVTKQTRLATSKKFYRYCSGGAQPNRSTKS